MVSFTTAAPLLQPSSSTPATIVHAASTLLCYDWLSVIYRAAHSLVGGSSTGVRSIGDWPRGLGVCDRELSFESMSKSSAIIIFS